jgi:hypothetical protein
MGRRSECGRRRLGRAGRSVEESENPRICAARGYRAIAKSGDIEAVAAFFRTQPFWRFGAIVTAETKLSDELGLMRSMKSVLHQRVHEIVQGTLCKEVKVIFESPDRADKLIEETFQDFEI